ncbi:hypothetical protein [Cysteiniphilum sp. 6C5]|uniref:hypothetical protein n=1 Tax=unclassified Cysteiniphilum TaxID=2610889 RepID=UPI003F83466F
MSHIIKSKAAIAWQADKPLSIETIDVLPPQKGEVRIKINASGVCHTDELMAKGESIRSVVKF